MKQFNTCVTGILLLVLAISGCNNRTDNTEIIVYTDFPINSVLYIRNVSLMGEKEVIIDSVKVLASKHDSVKLYVPRNQEKLYRLTMKDNNRLQAMFINDADVIKIHANYFHSKCIVSGSNATVSLKKLNDDQALFANSRFKLYSVPLDSLKKLHITRGKQYDTLIAGYNKQLKEYFKRYITYDDTVKDPVAFLSVYNIIDFGDDYNAFKEFVLRNAARFPKYQPIQQAKKEAMDVIRVHTEEFYVGDRLPSVTLPDIDGRPFSTSTLKGQYYLIDIWATYCPQCAAFKAAEMKLYIGKQPKIKLVSIAMDDDRQAWQAVVKKNNMQWINLIDEKMWTGTAVNTLLFDSIPINFLVSPQGKIIKKAIKPDSLAIVLSQLK